jgi:hypothetical protein
MARREATGLTALDATALDEMHHEHVVQPILAVDYAATPRPVLGQPQPGIVLHWRQAQGRAPWSGPRGAAVAAARDAGASKRTVSVTFARRWRSARERRGSGYEHQQSTRRPKHEQLHALLLWQRAECRIVQGWRRARDS